MKTTKTKITKKIEDTMACSAFAEAGEPCPIGSGKKEAKAPKAKTAKKSVIKAVEDTMACTAFAESSEPCPLDKDKKKSS